MTGLVNVSGGRRGRTMFLAVLVVAAILFPGCGGCKKAAPPARPSVQVPVSSTALPQPAEPGPAAAAGPPPTLEVLKLMPDCATAAIAFPSLSSVLDKSSALAKRLFPDGGGVGGAVTKRAAEVARKAGLPNSADREEVAKIGVDPDAPFAIFVDTAPVLASARGILGGLKALLGADGKLPRGKESEAADVIETLRMPAFTAVIECRDVSKVEAFLRNALQTDNGLDPASIRDFQAAETVIHRYEPDGPAYFVLGNKLVAGFSQRMVEETLIRFSEPAPVRYGTSQCPAILPGEVVALVRMDKVAILATDLYPVLRALRSPAVSLSTIEGPEALDDFLRDYTCPDPTVAILGATDDRVDLLLLTDPALNPGLAKSARGLAPLRLATMLPENTSAMADVRLDALVKKHLPDWLAPAPEDGPVDMRTQQARSIVAGVVGALGDEVALGIAGPGPTGLPAVLLLAALANSAQTKQMISALVPLAPVEGSKDTFTVTTPLPVPVYLAFAGDIAVLSNDLEKLRATAGLAENKSGSAYISLLQPPFDPSIPRYGALVFNTALLPSLLAPFSVSGAVSPETLGTLTGASQVLREVRVMVEVRDGWLEKRLTVFLKPSLSPSAPRREF